MSECACIVKLYAHGVPLSILECGFIFSAPILLNYAKISHMKARYI